MTSPYPPPQPRSEALALIRELAGAACLLVGVVLVLAVLYVTDWRLGVGGTGVALIATGTVLGLNR